MLFRTAQTPMPTASRSLLALAVALITTAAPALAQETREAHLAAQQVEKAMRLRPYEPTPLEGRIEKAEKVNGMLFTRPVYPFIGTTFEGSGLAVGPGYRGRFNDSGAFDVHAAWSVKNYKTADATMKLPAVANNRVSVGVRANWLDAPNVEFHGIGNNSRLDDHADYSYRTTTMGAFARVQTAPLFAVGGGLDSIQIESRPVADNGAIAAADSTYSRSHVFAEVDLRTSPGYTRRGGFYRLERSDYQQANAGAQNFRRVDAEIRQFVPVLRENWIIALRALASSTDTAPGENVPYFLMPDLGGSRMLRGYAAWRFRDRNRLLLTGEYRWTAGPLVDMALFVDAGKVAPRARDLDLRDLRTTYGVGMSIHTPVSTVTRIEIARAAEGTSLVVAFGPSF